MYRALVDLVKRNPVLKANPAYYLAQRARSFRGVRARPEATSRPEVVRALDRDGVATIPGLFSPAEVDGWRQEVVDLTAKVLAGGYSGEFFLNPDRPASILRIANAHEVIPSTRTFFQHPVLEEIARAYVAPDVRSFRHEIDVRFATGGAVQGDLFHFDNWRPILKAFLLLDNVGEEQAPFRYLCGSHRWGWWRYQYELDFDVKGPDGRFGHFLPQEARKLKRDLNWEEMVGTGPAGTVILADVRGLHAGSPLRSGQRPILSNTWDLMNSRSKS